ncbi:hypothetical protein COY27_03600 [Candidatus Woesearchaeota archaeon CG_4_10_14_0_2_um_filter_33_13]|nr:MAG: hypothetical protein COY27_03600 [Candidatus Woesearchaeota archaeon CG_4_10_14_0_2_um_filter_33_13]
MNILIKRETEQKQKNISFSKNTVKDLLEQLKINPETVILTRNNEVLTEDDVLNDKDSLEILNVVSGG